MADWVHAVERAYVAAATGGAPPRAADRARCTLPRARAAAGAVASHYLAVGTPRSIGARRRRRRRALARRASHVVLADATSAARRARLAAAVGGRVVSLAEALDRATSSASTSRWCSRPAQLRRGTHVNALVEIELDASSRALATIVDEAQGLPALAAGLVDGRQLDELTVFVAGDASIAALGAGHPGRLIRSCRSAGSPLARSAMASCRVRPMTDRWSGRPPRCARRASGRHRPSCGAPAAAS